MKIKAHILQDKRFVFLGAGNMGEALIKALAGSKQVSVAQITAVDTDREKLDRVVRSSGVRISSTYDKIAESDIIIIAVKPQQMEELIKAIRKFIDEKKLIISAAAGISTRWLEERLGTQTAVIRSMPNMPVLAGQGATALCRGTYATDQHAQLADAFFKFSGKVVHVSEEQMNAVTALSGSGPAYVFYIIEAMLKAGTSLGLAEKDVLELTQQTVSGAVELLRKTGEKPEFLRKKVTSPGGTTEAAIAVMDAKKLQAIIIEAIQKAKERADELARN
ncbi:MAG: pyrroline-5-carboxylate reductase [bacterium]